MSGMTSNKNLPLTDLRFLQSRFDEISIEEGQNWSEVELLLLSTHADLSRRLDESRLQESVTVRNNQLARKLAVLLINSDGGIDEAALDEATAILERNVHQIGPERHLESRRRAHLLRCLRSLKEEAVRRALLSIHKPHASPSVEPILRATLLLEESAKLTDADTRRAALSAWFVYLRQNVGSCFATAPAIMIQREQPLAFFRDLDALISTERLQRTVAGVEYAVPLNPSWGVGELRRPVWITRKTPLGDAPGFRAAMEAVDIKVDEQVLGSFLPEASFVAPEELIQALLMAKHEISREDLEEYRLRSRGRLDQRFTGGSATSKGKERQCAAFLDEKQRAEQAFNLLTENPLLKCWEFTLASFTESKHDFAKWNLYASLGMATSDEGGIGHRLYELLKEKVDEFNREVERHQQDYEPIYDHVKYLETRVRTSSSEEEMKYLQMELRSRVAEMNHVLELRDHAAYKAKLFSNLYSFLLEEYNAYFPQYFQEVYDPNVREVSVGPYDDSPAGFRLLYKHGRSQTSTWTLIHSLDEYVDVLKSFFVATEPEIAAAEGLEKVQDDVREVVTQLVAHVQSELFLESAFHRMARYHRSRPIKDPLRNLDKVQKKPWVYTSGGTMDALLSSYYRREGEPEKLHRWIEEPLELLVFLVDTARGLPGRFQDELEKNCDRSVMMHSPTHAFIFKPGWEPFRLGWQSEVYSYTYVRDNWIAPRKRFVEEMRVDREEQARLLDLVSKELPPQIGERVRGASTRGSLSPIEFRELLCKEFGSEYGRLADAIDEVLYLHLPMVEARRLPRLVRELFELMGLDGERFAARYEELESRAVPSYVTSHEVVHLCKVLLLDHFNKTSSEMDWEAKILNAMRKKKLKPRKPIAFSDSNWVKHHFAFVVNPGSGELEMWRMEDKGERGAPMSVWRQWLDGSQKKPDWGIYHHPEDYGALNE